MQWAAAPPTLDGKADEAAWQRATPITQFTQWPPAPRGERSIRLLWAADGLYWFATLPDGDIRPFGDRHNDTLWKGDVVELFIKPDAAKPAYYEFQVNPQGLQVEFFIPVPATPLAQRQRQAALGMQSAVRRTPQGWQVEARIPWPAFTATGGMPSGGDIWRFTAAFWDHGGDTPQLGATAALAQPDFHRTQEYDPLRFVAP